MVALQTSSTGTWSVVHNGIVLGAQWHLITWNTESCASPHEPSGTSLIVEARAADAETALASEPYMEIKNGAPFFGMSGRFIQIRVRFKGMCPGQPFETPVLCDLRVIADLQSGLDCQPNGIPDECEPDCNANGIPDDCELGCNTLLGDFNGDGVVDSDDQTGFNACFSGPGVLAPPECLIGDFDGDKDVDLQDYVAFLAAFGETVTCVNDCNGNGVLDECDIATGTSPDTNIDGIPDECQGFPVGACCLPDETCITTTQEGCALQDGLYHGDGTACGGALFCDALYRKSVLRKLVPLMHPVMCEALTVLGQPERCANLNDELWIEISDDRLDYIITVFMEDGGPNLLLRIDASPSFENPVPLSQRAVRAALQPDSANALVGVNFDFVAWMDNQIVSVFAAASETVKICNVVQQGVKGLITVNNPCYMHDVLRKLWLVFNQEGQSESFCPPAYLDFFMCITLPFDFGLAGDARNILILFTYYDSLTTCEAIYANSTPDALLQIRQAIESVRLSVLPLCPNPGSVCP